MNKEDLIQFVMERADKEYSDDFPISRIPEWINQFFDKNDPERSKREDSCEHYFIKQMKMNGKLGLPFCEKCGITRDAVL